MGDTQQVRGEQRLESNLILPGYDPRGTTKDRGSGLTFIPVPTLTWGFLPLAESLLKSYHSSFKSLHNSNSFHQASQSAQPSGISTFSWIPVASIVLKNTFDSSLSVLCSWYVCVHTQIYIWIFIPAFISFTKIFEYLLTLYAMLKTIEKKNQYLTSIGESGKKIHDFNVV